MQTYWDSALKHRVYPIDAPPDATQAERRYFRENLKRVARAEAGRCPYCGQLPDPGRKTCPRCLEIQRRIGARRRERMRAKRDAERRAARPRSCPKCSGTDLRQTEIRHGRPYYKCRACGRSSFGDGPPNPPPDYPCPYCRGRCIKYGHETVAQRKRQRYHCTVCGRNNLNLWPARPRSPGGPFRHAFHFNLSFRADAALQVYCQTHKLSVCQAIRDILIRAAETPPLRPSLGRPGIQSKSPMLRAYLASVSAAANPAPQLPVIPPEGIRLPSALPAAVEKLNRHRRDGRFTPSILVTFQTTVFLNDLALASLLELMRRRNLNHQDTVRAVITETQPQRAPITIAASPNDLANNW